MSELPRRAPRAKRDVLKSRALAGRLNAQDPTEDPYGWQISETGTVWTEVVGFPGTDREVRAQVVAFEPGFYLIALPLTDVAGLYSPESATTLAGATAVLEGRNRP